MIHTYTNNTYIYISYLEGNGEGEYRVVYKKDAKSQRRLVLDRTSYM